MHTFNRNSIPFTFIILAGESRTHSLFASFSFWLAYAVSVSVHIWSSHKIWNVSCKFRNVIKFQFNATSDVEKRRERMNKTGNKSFGIESVSFFWHKIWRKSFLWHFSIKLFLSPSICNNVFLTGAAAAAAAALIAAHQNYNQNSKSERAGIVYYLCRSE